MGAMIVYNTATALSIDNIAAGLMYTNVQGAKNKTTNVMWETQVERAMHLAAKLKVLREHRMAKQETSKRRKFDRQTKPLLAATES